MTEGAVIPNRGGWRRRALGILLWGLAAAAALMVAWAVAIGPVTVWRVVTHGTTTVWDHLSYPGRGLPPSESPLEWDVELRDLPTTVTLDGSPARMEEVLAGSRTLSFLAVSDGVIVHEWYAEGHSSDRVVMLFSVTKSLLSMLIGAAIDDGLLGPIDTPVTEQIPELAGTGFAGLDLEALLRMDSGLAYVEGDNPFGEHVAFNYTNDLTSAILGLEVGPSEEAFRYKSGDYAVLGLVLDRALGDGTSITGYFGERLWEPLGATSEAAWSTDREGGLERVWCCLATTARDLARFGQLMLDRGRWGGEQLLSEAWVDASLTPGYGPDRWPDEYQGSPLANYGLGWWVTKGGAALALGKDGQYLYVDRDRGVVIVRQGEASGDHSWVELFEQMAAGLG